jgi:hypothetical protein
MRIDFRNGSYIESEGVSEAVPIRGKSSKYISFFEDEKEDRQMGKIELTDTVIDILTKMSEGNPGALTCLMEMMKKKDWYFPDMEPLFYILHLDELGLYGSQLYILWNDCCNRDLDLFETVMRNHQMRRLSRAALLSNLEGGRGKPFEELVPLSELFPRGEEQ